MELKYKSAFKRDLEACNRTLVTTVYETVLNVKSAKSIAQIHQLKKLRKYKTLYRIKVAENYRIGVVIRNNTVWFACMGHRSNFYSKFP